jgi:hypothetical protein
LENPIAAASYILEAPVDDASLETLNDFDPSRLAASFKDASSELM